MTGVQTCALPISGPASPLSFLSFFLGGGLSRVANSFILLRLATSHGTISSVCPSPHLSVDRSPLRFPCGLAFPIRHVGLFISYTVPASQAMQEFYIKRPIPTPSLTRLAVHSLCFPQQMSGPLSLSVLTFTILLVIAMLPTEPILQSCRLDSPNLTFPSGGDREQYEANATGTEILFLELPNVPR